MPMYAHVIQWPTLIHEPKGSKRKLTQPRLQKDYPRILPCLHQTHAWIASELLGSAGVARRLHRLMSKSIMCCISSVFICTQPRYSSYVSTLLLSTKKNTKMAWWKIFKPIPCIFPPIGTFETLKSFEQQIEMTWSDGPCIARDCYRIRSRWPGGRRL